MDYSLKEVAGRIKDLREAKGYTQEELAKLTGVSFDDYKVLEMGETDFSFTFIYKCAKACDVEVVDLLEGTSTTLTSFAITRKGEGLKIVKKHGVEYNNLAPKFREKLAEPFLVKFPYLEEEQNAPMQLNSHNGQEFDVIVKGSLKVQVGNHVDVLHDPKGEIIGTYAYGDDYLREFELAGDGFTVLLLNRYQSGSVGRLVSIGPEGEELGSLDIRKEVLSVSACGRYIAVLYSGSLVVYNQNLQVYATLNGITDIKEALVRADGSALLMSSQSAGLFLP